MAVAGTSQEPCFDEECKVEETIYKRRSSIFQTGTITYDQYKDDNKETSSETKLISDNNEESNAQTDVENFNLKEYTEKLKQERIDWLQEYKRRKTQRRNLTNQKTNVMGQGQPLDINILTEAEKAFVLACPNYEYICKNSKKLLDTTMKLSILSQIVHKLNWRFMKKMEGNIAKTTRSVIRMSKH